MGTRQASTGSPGKVGVFAHLHHPADVAKLSILDRFVLPNPPMRFEIRDAEMVRQVELFQTSPVSPDSIRPSPSYVAPKVMYNWVLGPRSGAAEAGAEMLCFAHTLDSKICLLPCYSSRRTPSNHMKRDATLGVRI